MSLCSALFPWGGVSGWHEGAAGQQGLELGVTAVPTRPQCRGRWGRPSPNSVCGGGVGGAEPTYPCESTVSGAPSSTPVRVEKSFRRMAGSLAG